MNYKNTTVKVCTACNGHKIKMSSKHYQSKFLDCSICKKAVIYNSSILCSGCDHWCHKNCTDLCSIDIKTIEKLNNSWYCSICTPNIFPFAQLDAKYITKELNPMVSSVLPTSVTHKAGPVSKNQCFSCKNQTSKTQYKNKFIIYNNNKVKLCIPCGQDQSKIKNKIRLNI